MSFGLYLNATRLQSFKESIRAKAKFRHVTSEKWVVKSMKCEIAHRLNYFGYRARRREARESDTPYIRAASDTLGVI